MVSVRVRVLYRVRPDLACPGRESVVAYCVVGGREPRVAASHLARAATRGHGARSVRLEQAWKSIRCGRGHESHAGIWEKRAEEGASHHRRHKGVVLLPDHYP